MKRLTFLLLICIHAFSLFSQSFSGRITDGDGNPIPYAALYIRELSSGFVTDDSGYFQTTIGVGRYTCEISSLGYTKQVERITVPGEGLTANFVLAEHLYQLKEVEITRNNEDPAYAVVRNAIASAPKYRYQVSSYTADTYLKGTGKLMDVPSIVMLSKELRKLLKDNMNRIFLLEEQRKVTYTAPNKWDNEVIAYSNTFPQGMSVILETSNINLYMPHIFGCVSPISPGAFSYYDYRLEGCFSEGEYLINKIEVKPKKDNPELISGFMYIVEDLWCISAIDMNQDANGMKAAIKVSCNEVQPTLFLSTSISLDCVFSLFGVKAEAAYLSSIKYLNVQAANHLLNIANDNLTTRQAYRQSRELEKIIRQNDSTKSRYKYELQPRSYNLKVDSMATKRDSLYWNAVRSIPLNAEELKSYAYKKQLEQDSVAKETGKRSFGGLLLETALFGKTFRTKNKKSWITFKDVLSMVPEYNFVDGLWLGARINVGHNFNDQTTLQFTPKAYYTTARKEWLGGATVSLDYAPRRLGRFWIDAGKTSADFNEESGESRLINILTSLLFGRSDIRFYNRKYLTVGNQVELANSLLFTSVFDWERRGSLTNNTDVSLFGKNKKPNIPGNNAYMHMPANDVMKATFSLSYTPAHYYRMIRGQKMYENSLYPTFGLLYQQAFAQGGNQKLTPSFKRVELSIEQKVEFGMFNNLFWYVNGGLLWDAENIQFPDFKHFASTRIPVTGRDFYKGLSLLHNYEMSTSTRWVQANVMWSTPYLLLKHLPFLRRKPFDEALHVRSLIIYDKKPYTEIGYSIGVPDIGRVGVFAGFNRLKYKTIGVSVSLPIF